MIFFVMGGKYHVRLKTASGHDGGKEIVLGRRVLCCAGQMVVILSYC